MILGDLLDVCRATGYPVVEVSGWLTRGRRGAGGHLTDGYRPGAPNHVMVHHTASPPEADGWPDVNYCTFHDDAAPLCNLYVARTGAIFVCAAMATNTNGAGRDPCGHLGDDTMNANAVGVECGNTGIGERWSDRQLDALVALTRELCRAYSIPTAHVHGHFEYAPARKRDPAGPERYATGSSSWDMAAFRADVAAGSTSPPMPGPSEEDDMSESLWGYAGADTDGAIYAVSSAGFKTWLPDQDAVTAKGALIAVNNPDDPAASTPRPQPDRAMFRAFGPVLGPRPAGVDDWGLPT